MKTTFLFMLLAASSALAQTLNLEKAPLLDAPGLGYRQEPHFTDKAAMLAAQEKTPDFGMTGIKICGPGDFRAIADVWPDTPAFKAGIRAGDYILAVDGADTKDFKFKDLLSSLRGKPGTPVTITLKHKHTGKIERITLTRISYHDYNAAHK